MSPISITPLQAGRIIRQRARPSHIVFPVTASMIVITGGTDFARHVYSEEQRGDWAQALPLVLEKLGYLDFETAGPEVNLSELFRFFLSPERLAIVEKLNRSIVHLDEEIV